MLDPKKIFGVFAGVSALFLVRKYVAGGVCTV